MAKLEIQIESRKVLKPSIPTPNHLRTLKLSLFDQLASRQHVSILFHYLPSSTEEGIISERCDKLQNSLAKTLTKFYPLAGRFRGDDHQLLSIHCNDEGVEYVQTKVVNQLDLAEFLHQLGPTKTELLNDLVPWPSSGVPPYSNVASTPLLGVQVNVFNCGGVVIGIQMSHIVADGFTVATFVKEWTHICQTGTAGNCLPSFGQLPSLFPARVLSFSSPPPPNTAAYKTVTRRFVFDALAIANLKNQIKHSIRQPPTKVLLVLSLIWKVLVGISTAKNGHDSRESYLSFLINLRGKSNIPHALGNCIMFGIAADLESSPKQELNYFVNLIRNTIRETNLGIGKAESVDDISSLVVNNHTKFVDKFLQGDKMDFYLSSSWCGFPWYEADFGWGKPFWVSSLSFDIAFEAIILMDTKNGDGIEAWVTLKENVMAEFERDPNISSSPSKL